MVGKQKRRVANWPKRWSRSREHLAAESAARGEVELRERKLKLNLYVTEMNLAHQALKQGHIAKVLELLDHHRPIVGEEDLRGFEWYYLWSLCHREQVALYGHHHYSTSVAVTGMATIPPRNQVGFDRR